MYSTKYLRKDAVSKTLFQSTWMVLNTVHYTKLTICPRAKLVAPAGKFLTLTVNGIGHDIAPGEYVGDVVLTVADSYFMEPHALVRANQIGRDFAAAVVVKDGSADLRVPALLQSGTVEDGKTEGANFSTSAQCYNGFVVTGGGKYQLKDCCFDFEGFSDNDFLGVGTGVTAIDDAEVEIDNCDFNFSGVTRCAVHAGGNSHVTANNCRMINFSPDSDWTGTFSWQVGFAGTNRLCQLADGAKATYNDCELTSNGWGICSIDGTNAPVKLVINRSKLRLVGPRSQGYGAFCIGENEVVIQDSDVKVNGYPMLVRGMGGMGRPSILGSHIHGRLYGAMVVGDTNSIFEVKDSSFDTGKATMVVKGSATTINFTNTQIKSGNGTIIQLMDTDECGMTASNYPIPVGEVDTYVEGRDLAEIKDSDVVVNLADMSVKGNFFNSTTNIRADKRASHGGMGLFHDTEAGVMGMDDGLEDKAPMGGPGGPGGPGGGFGPGGPGGPGGGGHGMADNGGPKNLAVNLKKAAVEGAISSALQFYREGLTEITEATRLELSNITQTAAPTVNNGVVVSLDGQSKWTVAETSYITGLNLADGAVVAAPEGKTLSVTLDGNALDLVPGEYKGKIVLEVK